MHISIHVCHSVMIAMCISILSPLQNGRLKEPTQGQRKSLTTLIINA